MSESPIHDDHEDNIRLDYTAEKHIPAVLSGPRPLSPAERFTTSEATVNPQGPSTIHRTIHRTGSAPDSAPSLACQVIRDPHAYIVQGAKQVIVDPADCFPLTKTREQYSTAVDYFASQFQRLVVAGLPISGCSSAGGLAVVVKIPPEQTHLVQEYLQKEQGFSRNEAEEKSTSKIWFGVVDGSHRHKALTLLQEEDPRHFAGYEWSVLEIAWHPLQELRAFSRMRNQMQRDFVDITVFDVIENLKADADKILRRNGEVVDLSATIRSELVKEICDSYCGAKSFSNDVMRNLARIALRLSKTVISHIGNILNAERQDLGKSRSKSLSRRKHVVGNCLREMDGRVFRHLINTHTFRSNSFFFHSSVTDEDRIHTLERLKWKAEDAQNFSGVKHTELEVETRKALRARRELDKLLEASGLEKPPPGMRQLVWNLLNTNKLDDQVEKYSDEEFKLVPELEEQCKRFASVHVSTKLDFFKSQTRLEREQGAHSSHRESANLNVTEGDSDQDCEEERSDLEQEQNNAHHNTRDRENVGENEDRGDQDSSAMENTGQKAYLFSWKDFEVRILTTQSSFDLVIGEPVQHCTHPENLPFIDAKEMKDFAQFTRRALVPGGTCFLILGSHVGMYGDWERAFRESQFETRRFYFIKMSNGVQKDVSDFPQDVVELCLVARAPGEHPRGFKYDLNKEYCHIDQCTHKRKFAAIDQIPPLRPGLRLLEVPRKSQVRPCERPVPLLMEVLLTFCPPDGKILDAFAGVFTTSLACLGLYPQRSLSCVSLEQDASCFRRALERLQKVAEHTLKQAERVAEDRMRGQAEDDVVMNYDKEYRRRSKRLKRQQGQQDPNLEDLESSDQRFEVSPGSVIKS